MSRFHEGDWPETPWEIMAMGRWLVNVPRSIKGKRGQNALLELESALLAMPEKRLISGWLATPDGEVCTVGLYCAARRAAAEGVDMRTAAVALATERRPATWWDGLERIGPGQFREHIGGSRPWAFDQEAEDDEGEQPTIDAGVSAGLTQTLAWVLGDLNDETLGKVTPEERWEKVLAWVRKHLVTS